MRPSTWVVLRQGKHFEDGKHKYDVLYSYLDYGLMHARKHVHLLVDFRLASSTSEKGTKEGVVGNPCLAKGMRRVVEIVCERTEIADRRRGHWIV